VNKLSNISIGGFRRLEHIDLEVRPLMVMIGANGVGKSSILDAIMLLSGSAAGELSTTLSNLGGIASVLTRDYTGDLYVAASLPVPAHSDLEYELHVAPHGTGYSIVREMLSQDQGDPRGPFKHIDSVPGSVRYFRPEENRLAQPEWEHNLAETALSQVPKMYRQPEELRRVLSTATLYHVLDVGPRAPIKLPQQMKPALLPGPDGEDLVPYLYYMRESDPSRFSTVVDSITAAFQGFESLSFPPIAAGTLAMTWKERSFTKPLYMNELSEGTLRFLWLVSLLQSPSLSTITMIDEPEVSLHPELLSLLADLMREASRRTQLVVATHSDRLVRFLNPSEVVVLDIGEDGAATATWADRLDLDSWLGEYTLDDVWRMGRMGGRA